MNKKKAERTPMPINNGAHRSVNFVEDSLAQMPDMDYANAPDDQKARVLPKPCGYKILITLPASEEKTSGGIIKAQATRDMEEIGSVVGFVIDIGPDAYADKSRFPSGPYCKKGDFVLMRSYSGTRIKIHGREFRIINDDSVEGIVDDPRGIMKV